MKNADLKNKHNHALTQWLKVGIFSLLMLAPLFASISQWVYVACNKNAKDSYSSTKVQKIEQINNEQSYVNTFTYNVKPITTAHGTSGKQKFDYISIEGLNANSTQFSIYSNQTGAYLIMFWDNSNVETERYSWGNPNGNNQINEFYFTKVEGTTLFNYANVFLIYETTEKLDNAFYYGVEKMCESDLFNWTENTALYTGIKGMTDNLEIGTPAIAILITYWTILTIAYVIIDILITGFTWITHLIVRND